MRLPIVAVAGYIFIRAHEEDVPEEVDMSEQLQLPRYDFGPIGMAIKREREARGISREALAEMCEISSGYVKAIENAEKHPGFQLFWRLVTTFKISVDEYFYPEDQSEADLRRKNVVRMLSDVEPRDVYLLEDMVRGLARRRADENKK
jgi:transcriptional regulator with XRE-family HTH domain